MCVYSNVHPSTKNCHLLAEIQDTVLRLKRKRSYLLHSNKSLRCLSIWKQANVFCAHELRTSLSAEPDGAAQVLHTSYRFYRKRRACQLQLGTCANTEHFNSELRIAVTVRWAQRALCASLSTLDLSQQFPLHL